MILYFPVSALVTLFGNIIQNPLDSRAKSDTRLMGLVVTFLSMLGQEAEQGGVHRMLGVCSEFVRIAKLVIERAEKEQTSRRKRKNGESKPSKSNSSKKSLDTSEVPIPTTIEELSPPVRTGRSASWGPVAATSPTSDKRSPQSAIQPENNWNADYQTPAMPQNGDMDSFVNLGTMPPQMAYAPPFQQPVLPQDLFALPMTLDWNWAEMSGGAYPSVENGKFGNMPPPQ